MGTDSAALPVARVLYKEINDGDRRKFLALSNDEPSGGGARDLRFGSYGEMQKIFSKLFPLQETVSRRRKSSETSITANKGRFKWEDASGHIREQDVLLEPPTTARPKEGRITRVHEYGCFDPTRIPKSGVGNSVYLLLIQHENLDDPDDNAVWPYFIEERSFREDSDAWDQKMVEVVLACIGAARPQGRAVIGFYDFTTGEGYCNGRIR